MRVRRLCPDRNPLRRATDRAEFAVVALLLVTFLITAPLTALAAVDWAAASRLRAEQAGLHQVPAVLLHDASSPASGLGFLASAWQALARWPGPAGPRTGMVYVPPGARAGGTVLVWTDRSGRLTGAPADVAGLEFLAAVAAPGVLSLLLVVIWAYAEILLDWRRLAAWDADWAATEPQWTGRR